MHTHLFPICVKTTHKNQIMLNFPMLCVIIYNPFWHGNMDSQRNAGISSSRALPSPQELDCTTPQGTWGHGDSWQGWEGEGSRAQQGLDQSHHSKLSHQQCQVQDPHTRILGFLFCLKKMWQTTKQTTTFQFGVSGRDGDFPLTQQNLTPWTQQMLFSWSSVILSLQSHFLSIPAQRCCFVIWLTGTLFPANHRLHTRNVLDVQGGKIWQTNTKRRHKLLSALCCLNSLWSHFPSCRWIMEDFSNSCSPFSTTERSLNDFFGLSFLNQSHGGSTLMYSNWNTPWETENQESERKKIREVIHQKLYLLPKSGMP